MHRLLAVRMAPATLLVIRNLSDETVATLRERAHARGQSLPAYVRDLLEREATLPPR
ncbi:FitA-like ribbon-helix-helix domain-containing protein [Yinghuangia soli]|uniref:Antitoxin FitA-like ribbon-helix-helix domain-containing protein n=1 Tax=Yinghuangia soli TaxID=2908204 RepID=A0AA41PU48_9ACTN|nr:hypothetical protein [Yinghuangia soli]MCF2525622.1 hypothetical protein [Yinghuangia soli]